MKEPLETIPPSFLPPVAIDTCEVEYAESHDVVLQPMPSFPWV